MEYRDKFVAMGGERLTLVPALNDDDRHAEVLADILNNHLRDWRWRGRTSRRPCGSPCGAPLLHRARDQC